MATGWVVIGQSLNTIRASPGGEGRRNSCDVTTQVDRIQESESRMAYE